jgi:hypothetical protein
MIRHALGAVSLAAPLAILALAGLLRFAQN